jgi:hypothetical protein
VAKSNEALRRPGPDIQWVQNYVADDKTFCVSLARDACEIMLGRKLGIRAEFTARDTGGKLFVNSAGEGGAGLAFSRRSVCSWGRLASLVSLSYWSKWGVWIEKSDSYNQSY